MCKRLEECSKASLVLAFCSSVAIALAGEVALAEVSVKAQE